MMRSTADVLRDAVAKRDLKTLEAICIRLRRYDEVLALARIAEVDLDELEELLAEI